eukprot:m51a1_g14044 hypothetical protein (273) ;mRNA; r:1181968-1182950
MITSLSDPVVVYVAYSTAVHIAAFLFTHLVVSPRVLGRAYRSLPDADRKRCSERIVASAHAVFATLGALSCVREVLPPLSGVWDVSSWLFAVGDVCHDGDSGRFYMAVSFGYWTSDLILYATYARHHTLVDYLHHACSMGQMAIFLVTGWGCFIPVIFLTNEASTPFLHISWLAGRLGWSPKFKLINQLCFAVIFFFSRIVMDGALTVLSYYAWFSPRWRPTAIPVWMGHLSMFNMGLFMIVQFIWFHKIIHIVRAKASAASSKPKSASKDQ